MKDQRVRSLPIEVVDRALADQNRKIAEILRPTDMEWTCRDCGEKTFLTIAGGNINCGCDEGREQFDIRYFVLARETTLEDLLPRRQAIPKRMDRHTK